MDLFKIGDTIPDFNYMNPWERNNNFYSNMGEKDTLLIFSRHLGCALCQNYLLDLIKNYEGFTKKTTKVFFAIQSSQETAKKYIQNKKINFEIIVDPSGDIYNIYGVKTASSILSLSGINTIIKIREAQKKGIVISENGNELQLPAVFIIGNDKTIKYVKYGETADDIPDPLELLTLL